MKEKKILPIPDSIPKEAQLNLAKFVPEVKGKYHCFINKPISAKEKKIIEEFLK